MGVNYNPKVVTNGLALYLDAANPKSYPGTGTIWTDVSNNYTGTLTNTPTYSSNNEGYFSFSGTNYAVLDSSLGSLPVQGSIEYWMYPTVVEDFRNPISTHYNGNNVGFRWEQQTGAGAFYIVIGNDAASSTIYQYPNILANNWYQVSVTWDTSTSSATGYLNGIQAFTTASHTKWPTTIPNVTVGSGYSISLAARQFKGNISKCAIYNITLSEAQILQNYNALRGRYGI